MPAGNPFGVPCWHVSLPNVFALASIAFVTSGTSVCLHPVFSLRQPVSRVSYRTRRRPAAKCFLHRVRSRKEGYCPSGAEAVVMCGFDHNRQHVWFCSKTENCHEKSKSNVKKSMLLLMRMMFFFNKCPTIDCLCVGHAW